MSATITSPQAYRWVPWAIVAAFVVVIAVNIALTYFAISSSTGLVTEHAYDAGNAYNRVLDAGTAQDALGWRGEVRLTGPGTALAIRVTDRDGRPLRGLAVTAVVVRPVEPMPDVDLALTEKEAGTYEGTPVLPRSGQWEVRVAARHGGDLFEFAQRIVVK